MSSEVFAGPLGAVRTVSTAGGGTALTTTATIIPFLVGTNWVSVTPRNFVTAVVCKFAINPYLVVLKTTDLLVAAANMTDASEAVQDSGVLSTTALTLNSFDTFANGDAIYVGSHEKFRGVKVTIGNTNAGSNTTLTVKYWNGSAWADISATDGTSSASKSFAQSGNVTWTVPSDWAGTSLRAAGDTVLRGVGQLDMSMYWTRWEVSVVFDASVTATEMYALNANTAQYGELLSGQAFEATVSRRVGGVSCVEVLTDAGTANVVVNVGAKNSDGRFA